MTEYGAKCLKGYEPHQVLGYFEQICSIPHGSGNTKTISDWIVSVAQEQQLDYRQDIYGNIIVWKKASGGYEQQEAVMLQGHMDMVTVKTKECPLDLSKDGLEVQVQDGILSGKGTSLGGDDGIAVAYMLAIMTDDTIQHPDLELVFTTDEEIGLAGISKMDVSELKSRRLINLDTEFEGVLIAGCAGGIKTVGSIPVERESVKGQSYRLSIEGLQGGHSGMEIQKERGNANLLLSRILYDISQKVSIQLLEMQGGEKDNAIPKSSGAVIASTASPETLKQHLGQISKAITQELQGKDDGFRVELKKCDANGLAVSQKSFQKILMCVLMNPNGVQAMNSSIPGTVETSLNCGILRLEEDRLYVRYALRSSCKSAKAFLCRRIAGFIEYLGGRVTTEADYPPWEYRAESRLREKVLSIYKESTGKEMRVQVIHAGLECGYLSEQLPGLDCVSIGPDMENIHTTEETLNLASVKRVWELLLKILQQKGD